MKFVLRYDLRAPDFGPPIEDLYRASLEQCAWADRRGWHIVRMSEHHGSEDGYCSAPLVWAAAVAAKTERIRIRIAALLLPLYDPVKVAEDIAVADILSGGRMDLIVGAGYVPREFAMFGKKTSDRPRLMEEGIEILKRAWSGEPFEYRGTTMRVTPRPLQRPHPILILAGSSEAAARRAARIADGFEPNLRSLLDVYRAECVRLGRPVGHTTAPVLPMQFLHIAEDPERAWHEIAPFAMHENNSYGEWLKSTGTKGLFDPINDSEELRRRGSHVVLTPEACLTLFLSLPRETEARFQPLIGGLRPEIGWASLALFANKVEPALREAGLVDLPPGTAS